MGAMKEYLMDVSDSMGLDGEINHNVIAEAQRLIEGAEVYRGDVLVPAECAGDYSMAQTMVCTVDTVRVERAQAIVDMRIILEREGYEVPDDASSAEIVDLFGKWRQRVQPK